MMTAPAWPDDLFTNLLQEGNLRRDDKGALMFGRGPRWV